MVMIAISGIFMFNQLISNKLLQQIVRCIYNNLHIINKISSTLSEQQIMTNKTLELLKIQSIEKNLLKLFDQKRSNLLEKYRVKSLKYYKQKVKNPFNYKLMQNYQDIAKFENYFQTYIKDNEQILKIQERDDLQGIQSLKRNKKKDIFQTLLTLNVKFLYPQINNFGENPQNLDMKKVKFKLKKRLNIQKHQQPASKVEVYIDDLQSLSNRCKTLPVKNKLKKSTTYLFNKPHVSISRKKTSSLVQSQYVTSQQVGQMLNFYLKENFSVKGLRIEVGQFQRLIKNIQGNQILTIYYDLPKLLCVSNIKQMVNLFFRATKTQKNLIAFLTYDVNKDGIICEQDLFHMCDSIAIDSPLHQDIYKINQYAKAHLKYDIFPDLNHQFVQKPMRKYLKAALPQSLKNKIFQRASSQKKILKSKNQMSSKLFTSIQDTQNLDKFKILANKKSDKKISINLQMFCKIFDEIPAFAYDLLKTFKNVKRNQEFNYLKNNNKYNFMDSQLKSQHHGQLNRQFSFQSSKNDNIYKTERKRQITLPQLGNRHNTEQIIINNANKKYIKVKMNLASKIKQSSLAKSQKRCLLFDDLIIQAKSKRQGMKQDQNKFIQAYQTLKPKQL